MSYLNFKAVLALPKTAHSAQTHKSVRFIWIVWSTLYVYLCHQREFANTGNTARGCQYSSNYPTKTQSLFLEKSELKPNPIFSAIVQSSLLQLRILRYHDGIDLGFAFHIWLD